MAEQYHLTQSGKTGCGQRMSSLIPVLLHYPGPMIVLDVKDELFQHQNASQKENPFWRDKAEAMLHALVDLARENGGT